MSGSLGLATYLGRRLAGAALVLLGVSLCVFLLAHIIPGDPVDVMLGESATSADRQELRSRLGLDRSLWWQVSDYYLRLAQGNLGDSIHYRRPVAELLRERLPGTVWLALAGLAVGFLLALPLGLLAALRHGRWSDRGVMLFAMLGVAIPNFWLGPMLILVFAFYLGWFPVGGMGGGASLVLPAFTLGTALAALQARLVRNSMLEVLQLDYVRAAAARGLAPLRVLLGHALRNALLPVLTILGLQLGALLTGAVVTEKVFNWPGVGLLTVEAVQGRDYPLIQGCVLLISMIYVAVNLCTDLLCSLLDPRIRLEQG